MIALVAALGSMVACTVAGNRIGKHYGHTAAGTGVGAIVGLFVGSAIGEALTPGKREEQGPALVGDDAKVEPIEGKGKTPGQYFADAKTPKFKSSIPSMVVPVSITRLAAANSGAREAETEDGGVRARSAGNGSAGVPEARPTGNVSGGVRIAVPNAVVGRRV